MADPLTADPRLDELVWYRKFGAYPSRITRDRSGNEYVIGDWSWNGNPRNPREYVEHLMRWEPPRI